MRPSFIALACSVIPLFLPLGSTVSAAMLTGVGLAVAAVLFFREQRAKRYDLRELQNLEDRRELEAYEEPSTAGAEGVVCIHCGNHYKNRLPVCPNCGR